jgi:predicted nucleic acid-binding Zn ribbon protein
MAQPEVAASILERLAGRMGIANRLESEKAVVLWERAVGENIARRARAMDIRSGILFVAVDNSVWLQELSLMKEVVIERVNSLVGRDVVEDIVFKVGRVEKEKPDGDQA